MTTTEQEYPCKTSYYRDPNLNIFENARFCDELKYTNFTVRACVRVRVRVRVCFEFGLVLKIPVIMFAVKTIDETCDDSTDTCYSGTCTGNRCVCASGRPASEDKKSCGREYENRQQPAGV